MKFAKLHALYHQPLFDLISSSRAVHLEHWDGAEVQRCSLLSIKTGGCSEDCSYCAQSAHYSTGLEREELLSVDQVLEIARKAQAQGATRFCMGAAWRGVRDGTEKFERVLEIVREVDALGMEVCVTLGEIGSAIGGGVVVDEDLVWRKGLVENTLYRLLEVLHGVVSRNNDRDRFWILEWGHL